MGLRNFNTLGKKIIGINANYVKSASDRSIYYAHPENFFYLKATTTYVLEPKAVRIPEADAEVSCGGN